MKVAVIGAGVSGVALAYELSKLKRAGADMDITVYEAASSSGGCISSLESGGYLLESGPVGILESRSLVRDMLMKDGFWENILVSSPLTKRRYLQKGGALLKVPDGLLSALTTPLLSLSGKLSILKEPFVKGALYEDDTVYNFASRRMGEEAARTLVSTVVGGIFAGDAKNLSVRSAFPRFYELEQKYGSLVRGMFAKKGSGGKKTAKRGYKLLSSALGMRGFVKLLEDASLGVNFRYNSSVEALYKNAGGGFTVVSLGEALHYDTVSLCMPAFQAAPLLSAISEEFARQLAEVDYAPVFVCGFGFDRAQVAHPLDGFGYLVTPDDYKLLLGCLFNSTLFAGRAPLGKVFLTCIALGDKGRVHLDKSDEELRKILLEDIRGVLGITGEPEKILVKRTPKALPQYRIGHHILLRKACDLEKAYKGLYLGGNSLQGVSVGDCIARSMAIAKSQGIVNCKL